VGQLKFNLFNLLNSGILSNLTKRDNGGLELNFSCRSAAASSRALDIKCTSKLSSAAISCLCSVALAQTDLGESKPLADINDVLAEITVTAQRRAESVLDVPYNLTALSPSELQEAGVADLNDLARFVPGLFTVDSGPAQRGNNNNLTLRGLRLSPLGSQMPDVTSASVSSVSTYYGESPVFFPLMLTDLERVEILRGPQGTLYGSGAEAGTIRFIPNRPSLDAWSGAFNASGGLTQNSDGNANESADGFINIPLGETLAIRASVAYEHLGGFIDAVGRYVPQLASIPNSPPQPRVPSDPYSGYAVSTAEATNASEQWQARVAIRWRLSDELDLQIEYLHHGISVDDAPLSNPTFPGGSIDFTTGSSFTTPNSANIIPPGGNYRNTSPVAQPYSATLNLGSVVGTLHMSQATLTSSSSYYDNRTVGYTDFTGEFVEPTSPTTFINQVAYWDYYPRLVSPGYNVASDRAFTQEVRLVSQWQQPFDYVIGGYFNNQSVGSTQLDTIPGINAWYRLIGQPVVNPQLPDVNVILDNSYVFRDEAIFGEWTWHVTPRWQLTGGIRFFRQDFSADGYQLLAVFAPQATGAVANSASNTFSNHVKRLNTSYRFAEDNLLYVTYSEGFRRGGSNTLATTGPFASLSSLNRFNPDFAKNYEVGVKGLLSPRLRYGLAVYVINLDDFQYQGSTPSGFTAIFNGNTARSSGVELELEAQLNDRLSASLAYTYMDAMLTAATQIYDLPTGALLHTPPSPPVLALSLADGDRLPGVAKHSVVGALDYKIPLPRWGTGAWVVKCHVDGSYTTSSPGYIDPTSTFYWTIPSSFIGNARASLDGGGNWSFDVFGNNLTDNAAFSGGFEWQKYPYFGLARYPTRPRTFGAGVHYKF
jgi:iron complex outermembrane recepter protein